MKTNNETELLLYLADTSFLLSHRCSEWCGHGPVLEQDIAISNIALDYLGQARNFYQLAAQQLNEQQGVDTYTEDSLAYLRNATDYKNLIITELPNNDWAQTTLRTFLVSSYLKSLYSELINNNGNQALKAILVKSLKEITYHIKWSGDWVLRLGDGTTESNQKMLSALNNVWPYVGEFFNHPSIQNLHFDKLQVQQQWQQQVDAIIEEATLPTSPIVHNRLLHQHTEHLGYILAEVQYLQRTYPNAQW
jgi:ring-1,2-phenylacetyl-CoA epoxidase subunit PaaC